ncbi:MAG: hypothetical protein GXO77_02105 [Calditrichaeota bacterium]|nr:hypothetical protein [Calditrichota bacterium]
MKQTLLPIILVSYFLLSGCVTDHGKIERSLNRKYYFEIEYVNYAWGYQQRGIYIDDSGNVYSYKFDSGDKPQTPKSPPYYSGEELSEKYEHNKTFCRQLSKKLFEEKTKLIPLTMKAAYSDTTFPMADAGILAYKCYYFDKSNDRYLEIILKVKGDMSYKNLSPEAELLVEWLENFDLWDNNCNQTK